MLCAFSEYMPKRLAQFLDHERRFRNRFREETLTDVLAASFIPFEPCGIYVDFSNEPKTGADMEWWFVSVSDNSCSKILLQAKRLTGTGQKYGRYSYKYLEYETGGTYQSNLLIDEAKKEDAEALYIFYNPMRSLNGRYNCAYDIEGVMLATASDVKSTLVYNALKRSRRSLNTISVVMFPLSVLFCPTVPNMISTALRDRIDKAEIIVTKNSKSLGLEYKFVRDLLKDRSGVTFDHIPDEIKRRISGETAALTDKDVSRTRTRIIFNI